MNVIFGQIVINGNRAENLLFGIGKAVSAAVDILMHDISLYNKCVFSPVAVVFKQGKSSGTIHIMLNRAYIYRPSAHCFSISSTPLGISLSIVMM